MPTKNLLNLQLFADGGGSGSTGEGTAGLSGVSDAEDYASIPASIPEKAKKHYVEALKKNRSSNSEKKDGAGTQSLTAEGSTTTENEVKPEKRPFAEIVDSEEYKTERDEYMHNAFKNRFKKYEGMEKENSIAKGLLSQLAEKYGIDQNSATFFADLEKAQSDDTSSKRAKELAEKYDMDPEEAKRIADTERRLEESESIKRAQAIAEQEMKQRQERDSLIKQLRESEKKTQAQFPDFNLESCMQNESFRRILAACSGDTTAAYIATHHKEIMSNTVRDAEQRATRQVANAVAANRQRPLENGLSSSAPSVVDTDFRRMNLAQLREYAAKMKRQTRK